MTKWYCELTDEYRSILDVKNMCSVSESDSIIKNSNIWKELIAADEKLRDTLLGFN